MSAIFKFKQFDVDQTNCAMRINTDGVLLGALAGNDQPQNILDIGTGTGVIAMMMAQRFPTAKVDAVEIDPAASETAERNFKGSAFAERLNIYPTSFQQHFKTYPERKYDLIISNPPFYINSLEASTDKKNLAKHAGKGLFEELMQGAAKHLAASGQFWVVLPIATAQLVKDLVTQNALFVQQIITIHSFADSDAHREILAFGLSETEPTLNKFTIYDAPKVYSQQYQHCLKDFFTIF